MQGMNEICSGVLEELLHCATHARESKILRVKGSWQEEIDCVEADSFWLLAVSALIATATYCSRPAFVFLGCRACFAPHPLLALIHCRVAFEGVHSGY